MDFAQRFGFEPTQSDLNEDEMPKSLRSGLWDICRQNIFSDIYERDYLDRTVGYSSHFDDVTYSIWFHFLRISVDDRPDNPSSGLARLRSIFDTGEFHKVYGMIEFLAGLASTPDFFSRECNGVLSREKAQFRFADKLLVKVTNEEELNEISLSAKSPAVSVSEHIKRASALYSDRSNPDFRNSIKESISAVEAAVSFVTGEKPNGVSKPLRKAIDSFDLHPALRDGFEKLYAFTSDQGGIRHALMDEANVTQEDAKYMLVSCSAFANYLVAKKSK